MNLQHFEDSSLLFLTMNCITLRKVGNTCREKKSWDSLLEDEGEGLAKYIL